MVKINLNDNDKTEINNYYFNFNPIPKVKQQNSGYLWQLYQFNSYFKVLNKIIIPYLILNWLAKNFVDFIFSTKSITLSLKINSIEKQQSQLWWNTFLYIRFQEINGREGKNFLYAWTFVWCCTYYKFKVQNFFEEEEWL